MTTNTNRTERFFRDLLARAEAADVNQPHMAIVVDPHDQSLQAAGPFPDAPTALIEAVHICDRINASLDEGEPHVVPSIALYLQEQTS